MADDRGGDVVSLIDIKPMLRPCPECGAEVIAAFNGVWLDPKEDPAADFGLLPVGPVIMAAAGGHRGASRYPLHAHQPESSE